MKKPLGLTVIFLVLAVGSVAHAQATALQKISFKIPAIKILRTSGSVTFTEKDLKTADFGDDGTVVITQTDATKLTRVNSQEGLKVTVEWEGEMPNGFGNEANGHKLEVRAGSNGYAPINGESSDLVTSVKRGVQTYSLDYRLTVNASAGALPKTKAQIMFTMTSNQ